MKRLPEWIKGHKLNLNHETRKRLKQYRLHTVCEEAKCPNRQECFSKPTATFLILGPYCTRNCGFCSVNHMKGPLRVDFDEPRRIALAARELGLRHVVITSVTRDDLPDGGASHFVKVIKKVREVLPFTTVEALIPDFNGNLDALESVLEVRPDVLNHNVETVPSLYKKVRPGASFERSLIILKKAKEMRPDILTKSGLMLGLGESLDEVIEVLRMLRSVNCDIVTIGQYLRPAKENLPVVKYISPYVFRELGNLAKKMGFRQVISGPLARSSMNAEEVMNKVLN
ncbi:MAG: lipoyl synthase [Thermodesulfovibrionales bacterium]|nr:lipoyl synthase [Thermodesulfovibrionales bacterium]